MPEIRKAYTPEDLLHYLEYLQANNVRWDMIEDMKKHAENPEKFREIYKDLVSPYIYKLMYGDNISDTPLLINHEPFTACTAKWLLGSNRSVPYIVSS